MKSTGVYQCPDDPTVAPAGSYVDTYAYNTNAAYSQKLSTFNAPADTVLLFEMKGNYANVTSPTETQSVDAEGYNNQIHPNNSPSGTQIAYETGYLGNDGGVDQGNPAEYPSAFGWHTNVSDFLLADGHVKALLGDEVSFGGNPKASTDAQTDGTQLADGSNWSAAGTSVTAFSGNFGTGPIVATFSAI